MTQEIMPELMKNNNLQMTDKGLVEREEDHLEEVLHPEISEQRMEQLEATIQRMQNMQQHVKLQHTLSLAWNALVDAGIKPVLLKGAGLAALYPDPQMRPYGDIDLFVGKEQYHHACAVMRNTFPKALKFDEELDHLRMVCLLRFIVFLLQ